MVIKFMIYFSIICYKINSYLDAFLTWSKECKSFVFLIVIFIFIIDKCGTDVGTYAAISILSILLTIAIGVIVLQRRQFHSSLIKRQNKEDLQKQIQDKSRNDTQYYDNVTALDEHQYISIDSKHQVSHYHNMP